MTKDEIHAEHVKAIASACFSEYTILCRSQNALEQLVTRHWDDPAFQAYMKAMGLLDAFSRFRLVTR